MTHATERARLFGLMAEFATAEDLLAAARAVRDAGYQRVEAYTNFPIEGLATALGRSGRTGVPLLTLIGGLLGGATAYAMIYYSAAISYPLNIGGRPLNSWPTFVPIMFELTVLGGAAFAVLGMFALNGLPQPYHPVFNVPEFKLASQTGFFLTIEARDPSFDLDETRAFLAKVGAKQVYEVEP